MSTIDPHESCDNPICPFNKYRMCKHGYIYPSKNTTTNIENKCCDTPTPEQTSFQLRESERD